MGDEVDRIIQDGFDEWAEGCGRGDEWVELAYHRIVRETEKAIGVRFSASILAETIWLPRSQILGFRDSGPRRFVSIPRWLAERKKVMP